MPLRVRISSALPGRFEPVEHLLRALVLPRHDRGQWPAGVRVPGQHRLPLVVEPAGGHRPIGFGEQLADGIDHRGQHLGGVLLDPAGAGVREPLLPSCLGQRSQLRVVQDRLDGGGPLVDSEQQRHAVTPARYSAVRRHHGRSQLWDRATFQRRLGPERHPERGHDRGDALGDPERRGQPGRADRGHVDKPRTRAEAGRSRSSRHVRPGAARRTRTRARRRRAAGTEQPPSRRSRREQPAAPTSRACPRDRPRWGPPRSCRRPWGTRAHPWCVGSGPAAGSGRGARRRAGRTRGTLLSAG